MHPYAFAYACVCACVYVYAVACLRMPSYAVLAHVSHSFIWTSYELRMWTSYVIFVWTSNVLNFVWTSYELRMHSYAKSASKHGYAKSAHFQTYCKIFILCKSHGRFVICAFCAFSFFCTRVCTCESNYTSAVLRFCSSAILPFCSWASACLFFCVLRVAALLHFLRFLFYALQFFVIFVFAFLQFCVSAVLRSCMFQAPKRAAKKNNMFTYVKTNFANPLTFQLQK